RRRLRRAALRPLGRLQRLSGLARLERQRPPPHPHQRAGGHLDPPPLIPTASARARAMRSSNPTDEFLDRKHLALKARAWRLLELTPRRVGLRPQDLPYAPSRLHFAAANKRLAQIGKVIRKRIAATEAARDGATPNQRLTGMAFVEREVDRARRTF